MKPVDKKDLPKIYVLAALFVGLIGYVLYTAFGAETPPAAASSQKKPEKKGASTPGNGPGDPGADQAASEPVAFDAAMVGPPQGGRDPFQPVGPSATTAAPPRVANNVPPPPPRVPPIFVAPPPTVTPPVRKNPTASDLGTLLGNAGAEQPSAVNPVIPEAPPVPSLAVTGVVLGDPTSGNPRNVAILRSGAGEERRFVSVGDYVGNGYTVVAVHADGVEIQDKAGNRRVTIKLGQPGDNARAN